MSSSDKSPESDDRLNQLLTQAALDGQAPDSLRYAVRALEEEARTRTGRVKATRSARQAFAPPKRVKAAKPKPAKPKPVVRQEVTDSAAAGAADTGSSTAGALTSIADRRRRRVQLFLMPAALIVVVVVVTIARAGGGGSTAPSVRQVASLAALSPAEAAPKSQASATIPELTVAVQGVHFPSWAADGGWRPVGMRKDQLRGRAVTTVFYRHDQNEIAYSIVATPTIAQIGNRADAHEVFHLGDRTYVIWAVQDHTMMLSGVGASGDQLWTLARTTIV